MAAATLSQKRKKKSSPPKAARRSSTSKKKPSASLRESSLHGGDLREGRRKTARPLDENKLTHLVLTSSEARGRLAFSTPTNQALISEILAERSAQFGIRVHSFQARGPNLHILLTFKNREKFQSFLRTIAALIARRITGARRGHPFGRKFWDHLAITRTIERADGAIEEYEATMLRAKKNRKR